MGAACGRCCGSKGDEEDEFKKGGPKDLSEGPKLERSCTDVPCVFLWIMHWFVFFAVTFAGFADGDPRKLYKPRDFSGGYCGIGDFTEQTKLVQMMNVTEMVEPVMEQVVCSSASSQALQAVMTNAEYQGYLCTCCLMPCLSCLGDKEHPDITNPSDMTSVVSGSMGRLTSQTNGAGLMSSSDSSYTAFDPEAIFREMTKYFVPICMGGTVGCSIPVWNETNGTLRSYTYIPDPDSDFRAPWTTLLNNAGIPTDIRSAVASQFTFTAYPESMCPYGERYCIPMPGVNFTEAPNDYCFPKLDNSVAGAISNSAAEVLEGLATSSVTESTSEGIGGLVGQVWATADALFLVTFWAFIIGLIFMVILRFLVGCFVWASLGIVFGILFCGGAVAYIRSGQCKGAGLLESGKQISVAVTIAAIDAAQAAATGETCNEGMSGNGTDYRGCATRTRSGLLCQAWDTQNAPHNHTWTSATYPAANLIKNYCRNPAGASTIWCLTTDPNKKWETCTPQGVIMPECPKGYMIETEYARTALEYSGYVAWVMAGLWILVCICMYSRIRLAIGINKVAAMFVYHTPSVLMVPIVQIVGAIVYSLLWAFSASFLISQVPSDYTSPDYFETYVEANGNFTTPGACNPKWPMGFGYRYGGNVSVADDPCTGNFGDVSGIIPKCYKCAPPRYVFDWYFVISFFSYLWNNALFVAMGQCIIAAAVGIWFFTKSGEKGKSSPVLKAVKLVLRYHLGTLVFGAFIIALIQLIRYFMKYLEKQAKAQKNYVMVLVFKVVGCCIWCFEKCVKFLNKNAYIQTALLGTNFCTSAKNAFYLILRNAARFATMMVLGNIIRFIGMATIVVVTTLCGYFLLQLIHPNASPAVPVLIYFGVSYVVAKLYMNVFGLAVDTALQCFIAVEEQKLDQDCVPGPLRSFVDNKGKETKVTTQVKQVAPAPDGPDS